MKANELRIGNIVSQYYSWGVAIPYWRDWRIDLGSDIDHVLSKPNIYNPIPLTEEWLIKFGSTRQISYMGKVYDCHGLQVYETDDDGWHLGNEETHLEIESVHQLQNLYFALTGEELTIK